MAAKVLIVDDHPAVREGLALRISAQPNLEVCGEAGDNAEAMRLLAANRPDVVIVDIQMQGGNGLDLIARIKAHDESIQILVCSMYPDALYAQRALHAGASGYINKAHTTSHIVEAVQRVREGRIYLSAETADQLLGQALRGTQRRRSSGIESLSDCELEVFRLIAQGLSSSQIAQRLHRSIHTVTSHRQKIKNKLNLKTAGELTLAAVQWVLESG